LGSANYLGSAVYDERASRKVRGEGYRWGKMLYEDRASSML
jgi:hypothetical protein